MSFRLNHMELTVPPGTLKKERENIQAFYGDIFGFQMIETGEILGHVLDFSDSVLIGADDFTQFFLIAEHPDYLQPKAEDHIGFLFDNWDEVDEKLEKIREFQKKDPRVELTHINEDFEAGGQLTHFFYFRYILPIWIDVQYLKWQEGLEPTKKWSYG